MYFRCLGERYFLVKLALCLVIFQATYGFCGKTGHKLYRNSCSLIGKFIYVPKKGEKRVPDIESDQQSKKPQKIGLKIGHWIRLKRMPMLTFKKIKSISMMHKKESFVIMY